MPKQKRGFAAMDPQKQLELARQGGRAAHKSGNAHRFTSEEATAAGRKGGLKTGANMKRMRRIAKLGGQARAEQRRRRAEERRGEIQTTTSKESK